MRLAKRGMAVLLGMSCLAAVCSAEELRDDESQRKYERKVQMQLTDMGMENRRVNVPIMYCALESQRCVPRAAWSFSVNQSLENKATAELLERLSGKRFDLLQVGAEGLSITTLATKVDVQANIAPFKFDTGSYEGFRQQVDSYLDKEIAPLMTEILGKAKDARYQEMQDQEQATFLADIAKEKSVPADLIRKLMNSAFVFSSYAEQSSGSITITEAKLAKIAVFNISFSVSTKVKILIHRFNQESGKFERYDEIEGESGLASASDRLIGGFPVQGSSSGLFDRAYITAAKAAGISANTKLKEDDNFSIYGTIDEIEDDRFYSGMGENEDLRIDAPYTIFQTTDEGIKKTGWSKVKTVAASKEYLESPGNYRSEFELLAGDMEYKDQLREHPWTGVFFALGGGSMPYTLEKIDQQPAEGGGTLAGLNLGFKLDMGYLFNSEALSEKWLELDVLLAGGGEDVKQSGTLTHTSPSASYYMLSIGHRYNLGSGLYTGFGYGLGEASMRASGINGGDEIDIKSTMFKLGGKLGYMFSPNTEFFANFDYYAPVGSKAEQGSLPTADAEVSGGLGVNIGFAFHIRSIGSFATMMR